MQHIGSSRAYSNSLELSIVYRNARTISWQNSRKLKGNRLTVIGTYGILRISKCGNHPERWGDFEVFNTIQGISKNAVWSPCATRAEKDRVAQQVMPDAALKLGVETVCNDGACPWSHNR